MKRTLAIALLMLASVQIASAQHTVNLSISETSGITSAAGNASCTIEPTGVAQTIDCGAKLAVTYHSNKTASVNLRASVASESTGAFEGISITPLVVNNSDIAKVGGPGSGGVKAATPTAVSTSGGSVNVVEGINKAKATASVQYRVTVGEYATATSEALVYTVTYTLVQ